MSNLIGRMRKALEDHEARFGTPRTAPIELTRAEYEALKAEVMRYGVVYPTGSGATDSFMGVRITIKEETK